MSLACARLGDERACRAQPLATSDARTGKYIFRSLVSAVVAGLFLLPGPSHADEGKACFPKCRSGYLCTSEGKCVSECNPPCASEALCQSGQCIVEKAAVASEPSKLELAWTGGVGVHVSTVTAPVLLTSFSMAYGGNHALLGGIQGGVSFFDKFVGNASLGEVGLNLGYRGIFSKGEVGVGLIAVAQPQVWIGSATLLGLGGAVGGLVTYKRLVVQVPFSVTRVAVFKKHFETSNTAVVFTPTILAGVSF